MRVVRPAAQILAWAWMALVAVLLAGLVAVTITGGRLDVITTPSMSPAIPEGSLALTRDIDTDTLTVGDVVTYRNRNDTLIMHRIVEIVGQGDTVLYRTQGDANPRPDSQLVPADEIEGRVRWSLSGLGTITRALAPPWGLLWLIVLPAVLLWLARKPRPDKGPDAPDNPQDPAAGDTQDQKGSDRAKVEVDR